MMPMYIWKSESTGEEIEILREFDDYQVPPTEEEAGEDKGPWVKQLGPTRTIRGPGWGSKGNW